MNRCKLTDTKVVKKQNATQRAKRSLTTISMVFEKFRSRVNLSSGIRFFLILVNSLGIIFMKHLLAIPAAALILTAAFVSWTGTTAKAQDPEFTQYFANPLYLNPAFAGSARCPRSDHVVSQPMACNEWFICDHCSGLRPAR